MPTNRKPYTSFSASKTMEVHGHLFLLVEVSLLICMFIRVNEHFAHEVLYHYNSKNRMFVVFTL